MFSIAIGKSLFHDFLNNLLEMILDLIAVLVVCFVLKGRPHVQ